MLPSMQVQVAACDDAVAAQVRQLLAFYLTGLEGDVERIAIEVEQREDRLGVLLHCCRVNARLANGDSIEISETQADLVLAITRVLDRSIRTLRRRLGWSRPARCA